MDDIATPRLLLRIIPPAALRAGIAGNRRAVGLSLDATVPADLIDEPDVLRHAEARLAEDVGYLPWSARARRLAARLGFKRIGEHVDPVDGIEYVYLLDLSGRP